MKTKDRILRASLKLFNEQGERNVTTNHIAAELAISPGNLYYHFRNKREIVYQLFLQYQAQVEGFVAVPVQRAVTFQDKVHYLESILNSMWEYRFLHRDLHHLLQEDDALRDRYRAFSSATVSDGRKIFLAMAEAGLLQANREQIDALILNVWVLVVSWISLLQSIALSGVDHPAQGKRLVKRAIYQIIMLEEPYLCAAMQQQLPALKQHYLEGSSSDPLSVFPNLLDGFQAG